MSDGGIDRLALRTTSKAGRLLLLYLLREAGVIDGQTLQAIGDVLSVNRSTILRDLRVLDQVEAEYRRLLAVQPWLATEYTVSEFAALLRADPETVRAMIRDGLLQAVKRGGGRGRWYIPTSEVDRFKRRGGGL